MKRRDRIELERRYLRGEIPLSPELLKKLQEPVEDEGPTESSYYNALIDSVENPRED